MYSSISARVVDASKNNMSVCYNAIESQQQLKDCYDKSNDMLDFATFMIFQGLRNVTYILTDSTDTSNNGPIASMIRNKQIDTMPYNY